MEDKITFGERLIKLLESFYTTLFKITKTRFGSGFIGFLIAFGLIYFVWIETLKDEILSHKNENLDLKKSLKACETEKANVREIVRNELKDEVRAEYSEQMNVTFQYMQKAQEHLINGNVKKSKDIEQLEDEVQLLKKRKEAMK